MPTQKPSESTKPVETPKVEKSKVEAPKVETPKPTVVSSLGVKDEPTESKPKTRVTRHGSTITSY